MTYCITISRSSDSLLEAKISMWRGQYKSFICGLTTSFPRKRLGVLQMLSLHHQCTKWNTLYFTLSLSKTSPILPLLQRPVKGGSLLQYLLVEDSVYMLWTMCRQSYHLLDQHTCKKPRGKISFLRENLSLLSEIMATHPTRQSKHFCVEIRRLITPVLKVKITTDGIFSRSDSQK